MTDAPIYLDHNATTPVLAEVREAMVPWLGSLWGNPSSGHPYGRRAAEAVAAARADVAGLIGVPPQAIVFTSGGTEADNLALTGPRVAIERLVTSSVEHPAIDLPAGRLRERGWEWAQLPVTREGVVDLERATALDEPAGLVSVILAQNETGVVQPVGEIAARARSASPDVVVHTDAAQAVGKIEVDASALGVDLLTIVAHKLYGPCGIGALYVRPGLALTPTLLGGGQEGGLRPGTEPVALIVGLGAACAVARGDLTSEAARQGGLRDAFWDRLRAAVAGIARTAQGAVCLPNTLHVRFPGCAGADVLARCPTIAASTGSACHADEASASGILGAMGLSGAEAVGAVRLTLGRHTTESDVARAAEALAAAHAAIRR